MQEPRPFRPLPAQHHLPGTVSPHPTLPFGLLRWATLPSGTLSELRFSQCQAILDEYVSLTQAVTCTREAVSQALHHEIGCAADDARRAALIRLRRALYQGRAAQASRLSADLTMPAPLRAQTEEYSAQLLALSSAPARLTAALEAEYPRAQAHLRAVIRQYPDLLDSLELVSPSLAPSVRAYLTAGAPAGLHTHRKLENALLPYLARCSVKTSPLSRFLAAAPVRWTDDPGAPPTWTRSACRSDVTLSDYATRLLSAALLHDPAIAAQLALEVNPDLERRDDQMLAYTGDYPVTLRSAYVQVRCTAPLDHLLGVVRAHEPRLTQPDLLTVLGATPDSSGQLGASVDRLISAGLIRRTCGDLDGVPDPLAHLESTLESLDGPEAQDLAETLAAIRAHLRAAGDASGPARQAHSEQIRALLGRVGQRAHAPTLGGLLHRRSVYESLSHAGPPAPQQPAFGAHDTDVQALTRLIALFDTNTVPQRLEEYFVQTYGVGGHCAHPLAFLRRAVPVVRAGLGYGPPEGEPDGGAPDPEAQAFVDASRRRRSHRQALRAEFITALRDRLRHSDGDVHLTPADVAASTRDLSPAFRAVTLFTHGRPGGPQVVAGAFLGHATILRALAQQGQLTGEAREAARAALAALYAPATPAQITVKSGNPVDALSGLTDTTICAPGARRRGPGVHSLSTLTLRHVPGQGLRFVRPDGTLLAPLYLGVLVPMFLPPTDWLLASLNPVVQYRPALALNVDDLDPTHTVRHVPRVHLGRFVLSRHTWIVPPGEDLRRMSGETEAQYWLRLGAWFGACGAPRQFFAVPDTTWLRSMMNVIGGHGEAEGRAKPQYFDLDSLFFLRTFERWAQDVRGTRWSIQELLPTPDDAWLQVDGRPHVSEWATDVWPDTGADA